jgi:hypothetical protein
MDDELRHLLDEINDGITNIKNKLFFIKRDIDKIGDDTYDINFDFDSNLDYNSDKFHYFWLVLNLKANLRALKDKLENE